LDTDLSGYNERQFDKKKLMTTETHAEAVPLLATLRETDDLDIHLECWFSDGQKFAAIMVDSEFPELAHRLVEFVNASAETGWLDTARYRQLGDALYPVEDVAQKAGLDARRREMLEAFLARLLTTAEAEAVKADITQRFGNKAGFEAFAKQQGLDITPVDPETLQSRNGLFPATFLTDSTEYAWRGWANRK
jgi:hypothetical protein